MAYENVGGRFPGIMGMRQCSRDLIQCTYRSIRQLHQRGLVYLGNFLLGPVVARTCGIDCLFEDGLRPGCLGCLWRGSGLAKAGTRPRHIVDDAIEAYGACLARRTSSHTEAHRSQVHALNMVGNCQQVEVGGVADSRCSWVNNDYLGI